MRIVTRPDFDGIVCAVILYEALEIKEPIRWLEPNDVQKGLAEIEEGDIVANLPYGKNCHMWFDHHYSNRIDEPFKGAFKIAPSAAGVVYEFYKDTLTRDYSELITETDKIDSANLSMDEVVCPEKYPYVLLSMTVSNHNESDESYWNMLVDQLRTQPIEKIIENPEVKQRCQAVIKENKAFKEHLVNNTSVKEHVSITDFREFEKAPTGNRFLVYSLFPESVVSMKIRYESDDRDRVIVSVGHSIFNRNCNVNVGLMLSKFEGGGHRGAGACSFHVSKAEDYIGQIVDILIKNQSNE